jgi:hypothetical protein
LKGFNECKTIAELNEARTLALSEINKEYQQRRKEIMAEAPAYKRVSTINLLEVEEPEAVNYIAFPFGLDRQMNANEIMFDKKGSVYI